MMTDKQKASLMRENLRKNITKKLPTPNNEPISSINSPGAKMLRLQRFFEKLLSSTH